MDFSISEEQQAIVDAAERVFADLCSDDALKALYESEAPMHGELWRQLADSGMLGLVVDEEYGGLGMTLSELCLILELQGRYVAPVPLIAALVEGAMPLANGGNDALKADVLPRVIRGELILCPVRPSAGVVAPNALAASRRGTGWTLDGVSGVVPYAPAAGGFVVTAPTDNGELVVLHCPADMSGVTVTAQRMTSSEPAGRVEFTACELAEANLIASGDAARALVEAQKQNAFIALGALQVGVLSEGLRRTAEYVSQRKQFGRPLGAFQAVSQQAANAYMAIESLRGVYWRALDDTEHGRDAALSARVAKFWVGEAGHRAAHIILHLHGGIGQDIAYPIHRYFLWGKHNERYLGTPADAALAVGDRIGADARTVLNANIA